MSDVQGFVEDGWGKVADSFRANIKDGTDLGAAFCVYVDGRAVVDLWGGLADRGKNRPWEEDTIALVASTTKGAVATCAHLLVQRGELDLDAPVVRYWPEFGEAGKEDIPVRWLLSHQAGLPVIDSPVTFEEACTWEPVIRALETQKPLWTPGTGHLYHAQTYGFLVGEVVKRITGKSVGRFFADEVAGPLGLSTWIGLPEECESRVARLEHAPFPYDSVEGLANDFAAQIGIDPAMAAEWMQTMYGPDSVNIKASTVGGVTEENTDTRAFRAAEFPGGNMFTDARSIARMYAATVSDVDGIRLLQPETVATMTQVQTDHSRMHGVPPKLMPVAERLFPMSLGFFRASPPAMPLLGPTSFGHPGSGGSIGFGDAEARVGFGYVPNLWPVHMVDPRRSKLEAEVAKCLG